MADLLALEYGPPIDRSLPPTYVYLCGHSMGGSGTLGIGMRHGDVFAAIRANVPAEVKHVSSRMYFPHAVKRVLDDRDGLLGEGCPGRTLRR